MKFTTILLTTIATLVTIAPVQAQDKYTTSDCLLMAKVYKIQLAVTSSRVPGKVGNYLIEDVCTIAPTEGGQMFYEMSKELDAQIKAKNANPSTEASDRAVESDVVVPSDAEVPQETYTPPAIRQMQELMRSK
jgi:hypothetical protein